MIEWKRANCATRPLYRKYILSALLILLLSAVSSVLGLTRSGHYNNSAELLSRIYAQDAVILVSVVPILAIRLWYTSRGFLRGTLVWLGSLAFMTYIWMSSRDLAEDARQIRPEPEPDE